MTIEKKFEEVNIQKVNNNSYKMFRKDPRGGFHRIGTEKGIRGLYDFITQSEKHLGYKPKINFVTPDIEKGLEFHVLNLSNKAKKYKQGGPEQLKLEIDAPNPIATYRP